MRFAIDNTPGSTWLISSPKTFGDAWNNLYAFSEQGRRQQRYRDEPGAEKLISMPRFRECHGWLSISGKELRTRAPNRYIPQVRSGEEVREISATEDYYAIMYEYIPTSDSGLDADAIQAQLDFLWRGGWCLVPLHSANWGGDGILLDMGDLICLWQAGWYASHYKQRSATGITEPLQSVPR